MKLGLYTVSYQGLWYAGPYVPLEKLIPKIAAFGFDGISFSGKRHHASPLDMDDKACKKIKEIADSNKLEIAALDSYSHFMDPVMEHREAQLIWLRELIKLANKLDIKLVKVFPGWMGTTLRNGRAEYDTLYRFSLPYATDVERWNWIKESIIEALKFAKDYGVTLALQNHGPPFKAGYEHCLTMINEIGRPDNLKMCLDIGLGCMNEAQQTDAYIAKAVQACKDLIVYSHYNGQFREMPNGEVVQEGDEAPFTAPGGMIMNYPAFVKELKKINYKGYLAFEACGSVLINHQYGGMDELDRLVKASLKYMRNIIK